MRKIVKTLLSRALRFLDKFCYGKKMPAIFARRADVSCVPFIKTRRVRSTWINYNATAAEWRIFDIFTSYFTHSSRRSPTLPPFFRTFWHSARETRALFAARPRLSLVSDVWTSIRVFSPFSSSLGLSFIILPSCVICLLFTLRILSFHPPTTRSTHRGTNNPRTERSRSEWSI